MKVTVLVLAFIMPLVGIVRTGRAQSPVTTVTLGQDRIAIVKTAHGITTRLSFQDQVQELICGDLYDPASGTGSFVLQRSGKDVFLKPVASKGVSNLFVKTGENPERVYSFDLVVVPAAQASRIVNVIDSQAGSLAADKQLDKTASSPTPLPVDLNPAPPIIVSIGEASNGAHNGPNAVPEIVGLGMFSPAPPPPNEKPKLERPQPDKSSSETQRVAVRRVLAHYPEFARASGARGKVVVEVSIDEDGKVVSARAISGHIALRPSAVAAARLWRFTPSKQGDEAKPDVVRITFNFKGAHDGADRLFSTPQKEQKVRRAKHIEMENAATAELDAERRARQAEQRPRRVKSLP